MVELKKYFNFAFAKGGIYCLFPICIFFDN